MTLVTRLATLGVLLLGILTPSALAQDSGEVSVRVARFGAGNAARQGEWAGILLEVADRGVEQRELILRVEGFDPDGDRLVFDRAVASNPGSLQSFWVYTRLPYQPDSTISVSVWPVSGENADREGALAYTPGARPLARIDAPMNPFDKSEGMIGVLGSSKLGLGGYEQAMQGVAGANLMTGHELTRIITGLTIADVPDRPQGLMQFDALVWGGPTSPDPLRLSVDQARAVRAWIEWGGHLIVVLPTVGQEWLSGRNPLFEMLPNALPGEQVSGVDMEAFRPLLTKRPDRDLPSSVSVRYLEANDGASPDEAATIIVSPDERPIVVSRAVGSGAVTLVGLDLGDPGFTSRNLPETDQFWHRVLGRRADLDETTAAWRNAPNTGRSPHSFDSDIPSEIAKSGRAYVGVLLGFVVFALYWVLGGPGGFGILAARKQKHHAWVAFIATVGVFTAIAWTGATALRPKRTEISHLTFLHQVHGQSTQRARAWASVLIPSYGDATIGLGEPEDGPEAALALVSPWEPPTVDVFQRSEFPDNREYRVDARRPDALRAPTRSTVKQVRYDWAGGARWGMFEPVPVRVSDPGEPRLWLDENNQLRGKLASKFPGDLEDVVVIVVKKAQTIAGARRGNPPTDAVAFKFTSPPLWPPGQERDLFEAFKDERPADVYFPTYADNLVRAGRPVLTDLTNSARGNPDDRMRALLLFPMLGPPDFQRSGVVGDRLARRIETHGIDLGYWFTRPCVIVIGTIGNATEGEAPIPFEVNGRPPRVAGGRTLVSWVYPLPDNPASFRTDDAGADTAEEGEGP